MERRFPAVPGRVVQSQGEHPEGGEVGGRVEQAEPRDEAQEVARTQFGGAAQGRCRRPVERERELRRVEAQVLHQHLRREHGQEGQHQPGRQHGDDVAEVGGERDPQIGGDVAAAPPARQHGVADRGEVLLRQHDVGRLPGHVHRVAGADADIGGVQGGQVVDPVAQETGGVAAGPQRRDDTGLVLRGAAGEDGGAVRHRDQFRVREAVQRVGGHHIVGADGPARVQTEIRADPGRRTRMVAGEHLDGHAPPRQHAERGGGTRVRNVPQRHQAQKGQSPLVRGGVRAGPRRTLGAGHRQQAQPARGLPVREGEEPVAFVPVQGAAVEHGLDGSLGDQCVDADPAGLRDHGGRDAAHRVEGQHRDAFVRLRIDLAGVGRAVLLHRVQYRLVERVGCRQLRQVERPEGADRRPSQHVGSRQVPGVGRARDDGPVLGQRAGLVQAQHVDRAQVVQGRQPLDDHPAGTGQPGGAPCQSRRDDDRQHLRRESHRDGHGERQRLQAPAAQRRVGHQHQGRGQQHETDERPGDPLDRPVEGARATRARPPVVRGREAGLPAGGHDHRRTAAGRHTAALEAPLGLREGSGSGQRGVGYVEGPLDHRSGLAGQRRLVHGEAVGT